MTKPRITAIFVALLYLFSSIVSPVLAAISYTYDANGNMTSDGTYCYDFNEANQIKAVKKCANNELLAEYYYDYKGNRKWKKLYASGVLQKKVFEISDEYDLNFIASNSAYQYSTYYYANGKIVGKKNPDGTKNYFHGDHLGSTTLVTKQDGTLAENTTYDPFGKVRSGGTKNKFLYTAQEKDPETELNYYDARYYDAKMRRFTQPDALIADVYNPQDLNRYSYVNNNPLTHNDPTGHCIEDFCIAEISLAGMWLGTHPEVVTNAGFAAYGYYNAANAFLHGDKEAGYANLAFGSMALAGMVGAIKEPALEEPVVEQGGKPYTNSRPSYAKGQVETVYENAVKASPNGKVYDPNTGAELPWDRSFPRNGQWDMGHIQQEKYSVVHDRYMNGEMTTREFLDWYRNPSNYHPESPSSNRSNKY